MYYSWRKNRTTGWPVASGTKGEETQERRHNTRSEETSCRQMWWKIKGRVVTYCLCVCFQTSHHLAYEHRFLKALNHSCPIITAPASLSLHHRFTWALLHVQLQTWCTPMFVSSMTQRWRLKHVARLCVHTSYLSGSVCKSFFHSGAAKHQGVVSIRAWFPSGRGFHVSPAVTTCKPSNSNQLFRTSADSHSLPERLLPLVVTWLMYSWSGLWHRLCVFLCSLHPNLEPLLPLPAVAGFSLTAHLNSLRWLSPLPALLPVTHTLLPLTSSLSPGCYSLSLH